MFLASEIHGLKVYVSCIGETLCVCVCVCLCVFVCHDPSSGKAFFGGAWGAWPWFTHMGQPEYAYMMVYMC
jgi:hypothetical protein